MTERDRRRIRRPAQSDPVPRPQSLARRQARRSRRRVPLGQPSRRLGVGLAAVLALLALLAGRLVQLQGLDTQAFALKAEEERVRTVALTASRGDILDRDGHRLAVTVAAKAVTADPELIRDPTAAAQQLSPLVGVPVPELAERLGRASRFVYLARGLEAAAAEQVRALGIAGVFIVSESRRVHPGGELAANVVGFTSQDGGGQAGVELAFDELLTGRDGSRTMEVDSEGRPIPSGISRVAEVVEGRSVSLTIDRDLQWRAQEALAAQLKATRAEQGSVTVMDPRTGEVLAMATAPTFDANAPGLSSAPERVNTSISNVFEPGSVNKVITAAAALEEGVVTPDSVIDVPLGFRVSDKVFRDAHPPKTPQLTFNGVIATSSNVGTITVAQRLGDQRLYDYLRAFGFGSKTGIGLPGESRGILAEPQDWWGSQSGTIPIGQGVSATALQATSVYATIANGGVRIAPTVVRGTLGSDGQLQPADAPETRRVISEDNTRKLIHMLEAATGDEGTAPEARIDGYRVAGKTGTARRVDPETGRYIRGDYTASFIGFAPAEAPRLVVQVSIDNPRTAIYGGAVAAPVFRDVMAFGLAKAKVGPTNTKAPPLELFVNPDR